MVLLHPAGSSKLLRLKLKTAASEPDITINWVLFGILFVNFLERRKAEVRHSLALDDPGES